MEAVLTIDIGGKHHKITPHTTSPSPSASASYVSSFQRCYHPSNNQANERYIRNTIHSQSSAVHGYGYGKDSLSADQRIRKGDLERIVYDTCDYDYTTRLYWIVDRYQHALLFS
jgi:hypothetical protein